MIEEIETHSNNLRHQLAEFYEEVADELDACNPDAFDQIYQIIKDETLSDEEIRKIISDFNFDFGEELENCNEFGFERLKEIMALNKIE